jgi:phenylpyruvate tautomerase PptA (4-oxalocrotonate tautomerase family)
MYLDSPSGTFSPESLHALVEDMTTIALRLEKIPETTFTRSMVWIYVKEFEPQMVFHSGKPGGTKLINLQINLVEGNYDDDRKKELISELTQAIAKAGGIEPDKLITISIMLRELRAVNWGVAGAPLDVDALKHEGPNPPAI